MDKSSEENAPSSSVDSDNEKCSSGNVTIVAETFSDIAPSTTLSSVKSEDSAEQLICKTPQISDSRRKQAIDMKSATLERNFATPNEAVTPETLCTRSMHSDLSIREAPSKSRMILYLGMCQLFIGVVMVIAGGLVMVHGAALGKAGAGLWSGCFAIGTGVIGVLAGINDCYGLYDRQTSRMGHLFLTLFLALSLVSLAAGNLAAVLAGTGLLRDARRNIDEEALFNSSEEEKINGYWPPILANMGLLLSSAFHCVVALISVYHTAKRVCSCFRPKEPFNHNQFDPTFVTNTPPYTVIKSIPENKPKSHNGSVVVQDNNNTKQLNKMLEGKLIPPDVDVVDGTKRKSSSENGKEYTSVGSYFGSANSKDRLVCSWLGGQGPVPIKISSKNGIRKAKMQQTPVLLVPATAGNAMPRPVPVPMLPVSAARLGYATLPMVPAGPHAVVPSPHHIIYPPPQYYQPYPVNDMVRIKRKRYATSSSPSQQGRRRSGDHQLTRSLERIYRQRAAEQQSPHLNTNRKPRKNKKNIHPLTEADVIRTYTGLDRAIAEQFIVACDESRHSQSGASPDHSTANKSECSTFGTVSTSKH